MAAPDEIAAALKSGAKAMRLYLPQIVINGWGDDVGKSLSIVGDQIGPALASKHIANLFPASVSANIDTAMGQFRNLKWKVDLYDPNAADGRVLIMHVDRSMTLNPNKTFAVKGEIGWDYVDNTKLTNNNRFTLRKARVLGTMQAGVAIIDNKLQWFIGEQSSMTATSRGDLISKTTFDKGALKGVSGQIKSTGNFKTTFTLADQVGTRDGMIVANDLKNKLDTVVRGKATGDIAHNGKFSATFGKTRISWRGTGAVDIDADGAVEESKLSINYDELARSVAMTLFSPSRQIPWVDQLGELMNTKLPVIGKTVDQVARISPRLGNLVLLGIGPKFDGLSLSKVNQRLASIGVESHLSVQTLDKLLKGEKVDLLEYTAKGSLPLSIGYSSKLYEWKFFKELASANVSADFSASIKASWDLEMGLSSTGQYVGAGSYFKVEGKMSGGIGGSFDAIDVLGFSLISLSASGSVDVKISGTVNVVDDDNDGRRYLATLGSSTIDYVKALGIDLHAGIYGTLTGKVKILGYTVSPDSWSKSWKLMDLLNKHISV